ncbi:MAG: hypothetical protein NTX45_23565 [Proteobacteria bacterium]|nr:hypothetical protein [Pseudomonadota bacterium]
MATLLLRNVPDDIYHRLKKTAAEHHRSASQEAILVLKDALLYEPPTAPKPTWEEFAAEMQEFWNRLPADERTADEIIGYDELC